MFLDDVSLGGTTEDILQDLVVIESAKEIGLQLNNGKSEIIIRLQGVPSCLPSLELVL